VLQEAGLVVTPHTFTKQLVKVFGKVLRCVGRGTCVCLKSDLVNVVCMNECVILKDREHSDEHSDGAPIG
jgi:hypothetical protein